MVSVDTIEDNTKFAQENHADFPILADPSKDVAKAYGVIRTDVPPEKQFAQRWTFYIGGDGKILAIDKRSNDRDGRRRDGEEARGARG